MSAARRLWSRDAPAEAAVTRCLARRDGAGEVGGRGGGDTVQGGGVSRSPAAAVRASGRLPAVGGTSGPGRQRPEPCWDSERVCSYRKIPCKTVCREPPLISMRIYYPTGKSRLCFLLLNA